MNFVLNIVVPHKCSILVQLIVIGFIVICVYAYITKQKRKERRMDEVTVFLS